MTSQVSLPGKEVTLAQWAHSWTRTCAVPTCSTISPLYLLVLPLQVQHFPSAPHKDAKASQHKHVCPSISSRSLTPSSLLSKDITTAPYKLNLTNDLGKYGLCYLSKLDGEPIFSIFTPRTKQSAWSLVDTMLTQVKIRRLHSHWDGTWIMRLKVHKNKNISKELKRKTRDLEPSV